MSNYKPFFARVLIKRELLKKAGSIIIPDAANKRHAKCEGTVVAVGPTAHESIKVGQRVVFGRHAGTWLDDSYGVATEKDDTAPYFLCADEDLLFEITED